MNRLRALFHPIFVFIGVQIAWIGLMIVWVDLSLSEIVRVNPNNRVGPCGIRLLLRSGSHFVEPGGTSTHAWC